MATPAQFAANIGNAAFSTGPRTEAGKQASSRNALTHGLTSRKVVLPGEDETTFLSLRDCTIQHYRPANELEHMLSVRVAETLWRSTRADRLHDVFIAERTQALMEQHPGTLSDADSASVMLFVDPVEQKRFALMLRYHSAVHREHRQAVAELEKVQKTRRREEHELALIETLIQQEQAATEQRASAKRQATAPMSCEEAEARPVSRQERRALERASRKAERRQTPPQVAPHVMTAAA